MRKVCSLPIILKGIGSVADVELADQHGIKGIVLSNHGGRSLDFSPAPIDVLIELREKRPDLIEKMDIYIDGGVRRGTGELLRSCLHSQIFGRNDRSDNKLNLNSCFFPIFSETVPSLTDVLKALALGGK